MTALTQIDLARCLLPEGRGCIALTGGGGKTTLMGVLGHAFRSLERAVFLTTTTKIQNPFPVEVDWFVKQEEAGKFLKEVREKWQSGQIGLGVKRPYGPRKWEGIPPEWVDDLCAMMKEGLILNEADGAYRLPVKAPASHEPVIPRSTTLVIPVMGMSALGAPLDETHVFRPRNVSEITGLPLGEPVTAPVMARLLTHPLGLAKGTPSQSSVVPFLNQAETPARRAAARRIAHMIFRQSERIETVLIGRLKPTPLFEMLTRGG